MIAAYYKNSFKILVVNTGLDFTNNNKGEHYEKDRNRL